MNTEVTKDKKKELIQQKKIKKIEEFKSKLIKAKKDHIQKDQELVKDFNNIFLDEILERKKEISALATNIDIYIRKLKKLGLKEKEINKI